MMSKKKQFEDINIDEAANTAFGKLPEKEAASCSASKKAIIDVLRANPDLSPER